MENKTYITLDIVPQNTQCTVTYIEQLNNPQFYRMYDLGIIKGAHIIPLYTSMSGNTRAYLITGSIIALREVDAKKIYVTI